MTQNWQEMAARRAAEHFNSGYNCAESVFLALIDTSGSETEAGIPVSICTGFGGGIGSTGRCCGA